MPLKRFLLANLILLGCTWGSLPAAAQEYEHPPAQEQAIETPAEPSAPATFPGWPLKDAAEAAEAQRRQGPGFLSVFLNLLLVLGLIGAAAAAWKRFGRPATNWGSDDVIRLWANRRLGLGSDLYLVEIADRMLLLARGSGAVTKVAEFDDPAQIADLKAHCIGPMPLSGGPQPAWLRWWTREEGR